MTGTDSISRVTLTDAENKLTSVLISHLDQIASRDDVAVGLWGKLWLDKYSDSVIDTLIYRLRGKLASGWTLKTIRNRGFILHHEVNSPHISDHLASVIFPPRQVLPSTGYLEFMNNPKNIRKTLADLFSSLTINHLTIKLSQIPHILIIDSYSYDNVDAVLNWTNNHHLQGVQLFFTGYDERALKLHRDRVGELGAKNVEVIYDDIRVTGFKPEIFNLVINDFRLNFNTSHQQNLASLKNMYAILKLDGQALVSTVVDARFESSRFGSDQQKAPLNLHSPWKFMADEKLERYCFTVPYYKKIFADTGFKIVSEFDFAEGKKWLNIGTLSSSLPGPCFRRFLLQK